MLWSFLKVNFLCDFLHGFRRGFSTITQLVEFSHDTAHALDKGNQIYAIFIDLSKAFDTIIHSKHHKLRVILSNLASVDWIASFLHDCSQYV